MAQLAPELADERLQRAAHGVEKQVWLVGSRHMLRLPRSARAARRMEVERRVLRRIHGCLPLPTPELLAVSEAPDADLCRRAPGRPLDWREWAALPMTTRRAVRAPFGEFLASLHAAMSLEEARGLGVRELLWPPIEQVREVLDGRMGEPAREALLEGVLDAAPRFQREPREKVLLHGDLSHHNIAFDAESLRPTGVFDFADVSVGDAHRDLRYDPGLEEGDDTAVRAYERARGGGVSISRPLQRAWHAWSALANLAWSLRNEGEELQRARFGWVDAVAAWDRRFLDEL